MSYACAVTKNGTIKQQVETASHACVKYSGSKNINYEW